MKDNVNNFFGTAPDKGSLTGPVLGPLNSTVLNEIHHHAKVNTRQTPGDGYW
jgi:glucan 1,3-beta-glucosidase